MPKSKAKRVEGLNEIIKRYGYRLTVHLNPNSHEVFPYEVQDHHIDNTKDTLHFANVEELYMFVQGLLWGRDTCARKVQAL